MTDYEWIDGVVASMKRGFEKLQRRLDNLENEHVIRDLQNDVYRLQQEVQSLQTDVSNLERGYQYKTATKENRNELEQLL